MTDSGRAYNFSPGPAVLPEAVLQQAQAELLNLRGLGLSVMEMSHRSVDFIEIAEQAEADVRELLDISDDYAVLFMHGGASMQFSAVPLNLPGKAAYVHTGSWSKKAIEEAGRLTQVEVVASNAPKHTDIVPQSNWQLSEDAAYLHYTTNETIQGVQFNWVPDVQVPLVADMSSDIISRPLPIDRFGVIYAGAQKNIGPAGIALVIVRRDLLGRARPETPALLNWQNIADSKSMYNTPPTFAWYLAGLVFKWVKSEGGLTEMATRNQRKAALLYNCIDQSSFYTSPVQKDCRSLMNIPFTLADDNLDADFLSASKAAGLLNLKGHRNIGGMRASLYNALPFAAVESLVAFMRDFEASRA